MEIEKKRVYYLNSRNKTYGTHSNFEINVELPKNNEFTHVVAYRVHIPKSYYLVQSGETFILTEGVSTATITVPEGNYSLKSFKATLTNLLNTNSPNLYTYTVTSSASTSVETGKLTYSVSGNGGTQPKFTFGSSLYEIFGFDADSENTFTAGTLVSTNVINLQKETTLYLHSDICNAGDSNILTEIFVGDTTDYSAIQYQCNDIFAEAKELAVNEHNTFHFYLTDENDREIDLNGQNMVLTLLVFKMRSNYELTKKIELLKLDN